MPVCIPCGRSFVDNNALLMHTNSKHPPEYECSRCDRTFKTSQGRDQHEESKHPGYECTYCDRTFTTPKGREQHEESKHPEYECSHCDRTFKTSEGRDQHEESKHPEYECTFCDHTFTTPKGREQHEASKHSCYECSYCDRTFKTSQGLDAHKESMHPDHECTHCDRTFSTSEGRDQHEEAKHSFHCSLCNRDFSSKSALDQHDEAVHPAYECSYCDKEFSSPEARTQHQNAKHIRPSIVYSSSYQHHNPVPSMCTQTTVKPAPVEQPRVNIVLDPLPTWKSIPAPPDDDSEECGNNSEDNDDNSEENCDDNSERNYDDDSEASYDDNSEDNYDDNSEENHDDDSEENNGDHSEETYDDDHSDVSNAQSSKVHVTATEGVANLAYKACGGYFTTTLAPNVHELLEYTGSCACQICERVGQPCSCGICRRAGTLTPLVGDEKSIANNKPHAAAFSVDSPGVIEPKVIEDSSIESQFREPVDSPVDELRDVTEDAMASQHEQTLLDVEHVVNGDPSSGLTSSRPPSPPGNENEGLDSLTCQIIEIKLKENGAALNSVRLEYCSVICETDMLEHHTTDAASVDVRPVMSNPMEDGRTCFGDQESLIASKTESYTVHPTEACDDQQTIPGADTKHQPINDLVGSSVPGLEHDIASSLPEEPSASDTFSPVEIKPVQCHSPRCIMLPQVCAAELESAELDNSSTRDLIPSPTPSEQGSLRPTSIIQESSHLPLSPSTSEGSADYFSEVEHPSTPSSPFSERSIVFVSAESIPEYLQENRAYLVATSAPSRPSSAASSYIRLPSVATSSDSMLPQEGPILADVSFADSAPTNSPSRLYCRVCLRDPCDDLTATMCGHVFCNRCIIKVVMARSACPVCDAPTLLYCLFRLDI